ncbi:hypothetical protein C9J42_04980 [Photobacterium sp. GB-56]|nr:GEVED domain-containing protein [Photobacterium sp. GB-56]PSV27719.1 hypothetical protein C9J42_04980 [Photobacterium sp. GB-56]
MLKNCLRIVSLMFLLFGGVLPSMAGHSNHGDMRWKFCFFNEGRDIPAGETIPWSFYIFEYQAMDTDYCTMANLNWSWDSTMGGGHDIEGPIPRGTVKCSNNRISHEINVNGSVRALVAGRHVGWSFNGEGSHNEWWHDFTKWENNCANAGNPIEFYDDHSMLDSQNNTESNINRSTIKYWPNYTAYDEGDDYPRAEDTGNSYHGDGKGDIDDPYHMFITVFDVLDGYEPVDLGDAPDQQYNSTVWPSYATMLSSNGPAHQFKDENNDGVQDIRIGPCWDAEDESSPNSLANSDDMSLGYLNNCTTSDENEGSIRIHRHSTGDTLVLDNPGVSQTLWIGDTYTFYVDVHFENTDTDKHLEVGIDFTKTGDFTTVLVADLDSASSPHTVSQAFTIPFYSHNVDTLQTYMRVRICDSSCTYTTDSLGQKILTSTGVQPAGEIEDYKISLRSPFDLGDAPFDANVADFADESNGPMHHFRSSMSNDYSEPALTLGSCWDSEEYMTGNANADVDDNSAVVGGATGISFGGCGNDDEDGVTLPATFVAGETINVSITYRLNYFTASEVDWALFIDWDNNNDFTGDLTNYGTISHSLTESGQGAIRTINVAVSVPETAVLGETYLRVRNCLGGIIGEESYDCQVPKGRALSGEVEDYKISIEGPKLDFGDAPDTSAGTGAGNYQTTSGSGGPSHKISDTDVDGVVDFRLGTNWDDDSGTLQNATATADDTNGTDDEDGISIQQILADNSLPEVTNVYAGDAIKLTFTAGIDTNSGHPATAYIMKTWIDWDQSGTFDTDEVLFAEQRALPTTSDTYNKYFLNYRVPLYNSTGDVFIRSRICSTDSCPSGGSLNATGHLDDGEVEDKRMNIQSSEYDFGDATDTNTYTKTQGDYASIWTQDGDPVPMHRKADSDGDGQVNIKLGSIWNADNGTTTSFTDSSDDGYAGPFYLPKCTRQDITFTVTADNDFLSTAYINAWIDFDRDGEFNTSDNWFRHTEDFSSGSRVREVTLTDQLIVCFVSLGASYLRFRVCSVEDECQYPEGNITPSHLVATDGEVEDYPITIGEQLTVSGKVYSDVNSDQSPSGGAESGISNVLITLHDKTTNTCQYESTDANGLYSFDITFGNDYDVYETSSSGTSACPPSPSSEIGDSSGFISTSPNKVELGTVTSDQEINFGDKLLGNAFSTCPSEAFVNPYRFSSGANSYFAKLYPVTASVTATSSSNNDYDAFGFSVQQNRIFGIDIATQHVVAVDSVGYKIFSVNVGLDSARDYVAGDISDDDILVVIDDQSNVRFINVDSKSANYLSVVGTTSLSSAINFQDIAFHPTNSNVAFAVGNNNDAYRLTFNFSNYTVTSSLITSNTPSNVTGLFFDAQGVLYMYDHNNEEIWRFPVSSSSATSITGYLVKDNIAALNPNIGSDAAMCRNAQFLTDFADAPDSYATLFASGGPMHDVTNGGLPQIGSGSSDHETEAAASTSADGDDNAGSDDEHALTKPTFYGYLDSSSADSSLNALSFNIPVTPASSSGHIYAWIDFDGDGTFSDETLSTSTISTSASSVQLTLPVPAHVQPVDSFIRLRTCVTSSDCDMPTGLLSASGEVEDHAISLMPTGDIEVELALDPGQTVTNGIPFNLVVSVRNHSSFIVRDVILQMTIPDDYIFIKAYQGDGQTELAPGIYDESTKQLNLGNVGVGFDDYATLRFITKTTSPASLVGEVLSAKIQDTVSSNDSDTETPTVVTTVQPSICVAPMVEERGDAKLDAATNEYIITEETISQRGYLWSYDLIDLGVPQYFELAVYLGDRSCNSGCNAGTGTIEAGADGMTFIMTTDSRGFNAVGSWGGLLGVGPGGDGPISPSVIFEFDTYDNAGNGYNDDLSTAGGTPNYIDHTAVYLNGDLSSGNDAITLMDPVAVGGPTATGALTGELEDGRYHITQFYWDPATNNFRYYLDGVEIGNVTFDFVSHFNNQDKVRFGFSGSTGAAWNLQKACFTKAPVVLGPDLGDAPDISASTGVGDYTTTYSNNGAAHVQSDDDDNGEIDLRLGAQWDTDLGSYQNPIALADDATNLDDEDGVTFSVSEIDGVPFAAAGEVINVTVTVNADTVAQANPIHLYGWFDFNRDGDWDDSGEKVISSTNANNGINNFSVSVPSNVTYGYSFFRIRVCDSSACDRIDSTVDIGEVEDYRFLFYALSSNSTCDTALQTRFVSSNYIFERLNLANNPLDTTAIESPLTVINQSNISGLNAIGFDTSNGYIYGVFENTTTQELHLFVTDRSATNVVDLGYVYGDSNIDIQLSDGNSVAISKGNPFSTAALASPTAGAMSSDNQYLYVWNPAWHSIIRIDVATQEMSVIDFNFTGGITGISAGDDIAVDSIRHHIYAVDIVAGYLYQITTSGDVSRTSLQFNGLASPTVDGSGNLQTQALVMDNMTNLYVFTNGGNHDTNNDNTIDSSDISAVYRINVPTAAVTFQKELNTSSQVNSDVAGCYQSKDFSDGDSQYPTASHLYVDNINNTDNSNVPDGIGDFLLGTNIDPEFEAKVSAQATGDNYHALDDEELSIPSPIIVETPTNIDVPLVGAGYVNVWVDLNRDYDFDDANEQIVNDSYFNAGANSVSIDLDAASANGYSGETTMRIRFCSAPSNCNTPTGEANDGEVEDHVFELLNRIVLSGFIFDDNGVSSGTAHDGIKDSGESGLSDFDVTVTFNDSGVAGITTGDIISTKTTRGDGYYRFVLGVDYSGKNLILNVVPQSRWIAVSEANITGVSQVTSTSNQDGQMSVNAFAGDDVAGLNFGKVAMPSLTENLFKETEPNKAVLFPHRFKLATSANVTFTIEKDSRYTDSSGWNITLYYDTNCDGNINNIDNKVILNSAILYTGLTDVCLISRVFVPANAYFNTQYAYKINASVELAGVSPQLTKQVVVEDTTKITYAGSGQLSLSLTVNNISKDNSPLLINNGEPGDILEYEITYRNSGTGPIRDIVIYENTPPFTKLSEPVNCSSSELSCVVNTTHGTNTVGYQGEIQWTLTGDLLPGQIGTLKYKVSIE